MTLADWTGTVGVALILLAYLLNNRGVLENRKEIYFIMNIVGSGLAAWSAVLLTFVPFIVLEAVWVLASVYEMVKLARKENPGE